MQKAQNVPLALFAAVIIGAVNITSMAFAYSIFTKTHKSVRTTSKATDILPTPQQVATTDAGTTTQTGNNPDGTPSSASGGPTASNNKPVETRKSNAPIEIGGVPQPAQIIDEGDGDYSYQWCSGANPSLPDGVCAAIISIAADPTASNPHLSDKVVKWLAILPPDSSVSMNEPSWKGSSSTSGTMENTLHTPSYGDIRVLLTLNLQNNIWVITEGKQL